jgi:hypothetical protein
MDTDLEWHQLREMEEFLRVQREEVLRRGAQDLDDDDWDRSQQQWWDEREELTDIKEDDGLEDADLAFITSILESFSKPKSKTTKPNAKNHSSYE